MGRRNKKQRRKSRSKKIRGKKEILTDVKNI